MVEQRYQAVLAVIADGLDVKTAADKTGVSRQTPHSWLASWPTCARRLTSPNQSAVTGSLRAPACSWASWLSCGAGSMRPGRCWRRWTSAWRPAALRS